MLVIFFVVVVVVINIAAVVAEDGLKLDVFGSNFKGTLLDDDATTLLCPKGQEALFVHVESNLHRRCLNLHVVPMEHVPIRNAGHNIK